MSAVPRSPAGKISYRSPARERAHSPALQRAEEEPRGDWAAVAQWRRDQHQAVRSYTQQQLNGIKSEKSRVGELKANLEGVQELSSQWGKQHQETERVYEASRASAEQLVAKNTEGRDARDHLRRREAVLKEELHREEKVLTDRSKAAEAQAQEIEALFSLWKEHAGLVMEREAPATLKVTFNLFTEEAEPVERACSFIFGMANPAEYVVQNTSPTLPEAQIDRVMQQLNVDQKQRAALPAFMCAMRRLFQQRLQEESSARGGA